MYLRKTYVCVFQISLNSAIPLFLLSVKIAINQLIINKTIIKLFQMLRIIPETMHTRILIKASTLSDNLDFFDIFGQGFPNLVLDQTFFKKVC